MKTSNNFVEENCILGTIAMN